MVVKLALSYLIDLRFMQPLAKRAELFDQLFVDSVNYRIIFLFHAKREGRQLQRLRVLVLAVPLVLMLQQVDGLL